jgi:hypothetical protein
MRGGIEIEDFIPNYCYLIKRIHLCDLQANLAPGLFLNLNLDGLATRYNTIYSTALQYLRVLFTLGRIGL